MCKHPLLLKKMKNFFAYLILCLISVSAAAQNEVSPYNWKVTTKKVGDHQYEICFYSDTKTGYLLYAPNQNYDGYKTTEVNFEDSSVIVQSISDSGKAITFSNPLFNNAKTNAFAEPAAWKAVIQIKGKIPAQLSGTLLYTYGKENELYPSIALPFTLHLEGGEKTAWQIKRPAIDINHPVNSCGDDETTDKGLLSIFLLGLGGGLIALLTPCVFPMIPLTVSFFTKRTASRRKGIQHAVLYAFFIFLIYVLLSAPFHFLDHLDPEVLNTISTNAWLNIAFFVIFVFFALSFFGYYEIALPSSFANRVDSKAGTTSTLGILFMALTLALVSFSCTGPILGSLLAGAISSDGGALQLSFGMAGFGFGLALPFALFSIFPQWLKSLPKSGGWLSTVKVILGFIELAMALKFLSNADMVKQWGLIKRETFIAIWIAICLGAVFYLAGFIRFPHDNRIKKYSKGVVITLIALSLFTAYLLPGIFNTAHARLQLISGFPPPACYSIYKTPVNCKDGVQPLHDYEEALAIAKKENKPVLIDFTGWACVNCRRMEEKVWTDADVYRLMKDSFVVVSLYVDERSRLPLVQQQEYTTKTGTRKLIKTIGDKWATFQSENFNAVSQPQYAIINVDEKALTKKKTYTPNPVEFAEWLKCGLNARRMKAFSKK
jgi:thiol:disulfide interchange protein DsbD